MAILSLKDVSKNYSGHQAVNEVSFDVPVGSIFGLLGPNGAGKTSIIRIITTITGADSGSVYLDGEKLNSNSVRKIGYMPEERGLYKKMKVGEQLMYLAELRGLTKTQAKTNINNWFDKLGMTGWGSKKVEELSKGMQQKVQFVATVAHEPKLLILDEPFTGLDPINTNLIKDEIHKLNERGVSIIFSTHRMEQVEEICRDIVLINKGQKILEGKVEDVKQKFKKDHYKIEFTSSLDAVDLSDIDVIEKGENYLTVHKLENQNSNDLIQSCMNKGLYVKSFSEILPDLNEIFITQVEKQNS